MGPRIPRRLARRSPRLIDYATFRSRSEQGELVVLAIGTRRVAIDGEPHDVPAAPWLAVPLDSRGRQFAHDPDPSVRYGQALGLLYALRRHAGIDPP